MVYSRIRKRSILPGLRALAWVAVVGLGLTSVANAQNGIVLQPFPVLCFQKNANVELEWVNNSIYDSLTILRDGEAMVQIEGDDERFVDLNVPCGPHAYQLQAIINGEPLSLFDENGNELSFCVIDVICPVTNLVCTAETSPNGQVDVRLDWDVDEEYDQVLIRRDGIPIDSIATNARTFTDFNVTDGVLRYVVTVRVEQVIIATRCELSVFRIANSPAPGPEVLASVDLALEDAEDGLANLRFGFNDGENNVVSCGNASDIRDARRNLGSSSTIADSFFYFEIADPAVRGLSDVLVAAIVFDAPDLGGTQLFLESVDPSSSSTNLIYQRANQTHELRGSGAWATLYWNLPGDTLGPSGDGIIPDFRIGVSNDAEICVDEVVVLDNTPPPDVPIFQRGNINGDDKADISDVVVKLMFIYGVGSAPDCLDAADFNDDGFLGPDGALFLLFWLFHGTAPPPDPGPPGLSVCGHDPTIDNFPRARCTTVPACE